MIELREIEGYRLALDRRYDPERHLWVEVLGAGRARIGMDPLGVETAGDLVQLAFEAPGTVVEVGDPLGTLEAAKFVGPLEAPVSGTIVAVNEAAAGDPGIVARDPLGDGWLVEIDLARPGELDALLSGGDQIVAWFARKVAEYRLKGMIAE